MKNEKVLNRETGRKLIEEMIQNNENYEKIVDLTTTLYACERIGADVAEEMLSIIDWSVVPGSEKRNEDGSFEIKLKPSAEVLKKLGKKPNECLKIVVSAKTIKAMDDKIERLINQKFEKVLRERSK